MSKKFINESDKAVSESLAGFLLLNPHLELLPPSSIINPLNTSQVRSRVTVLSGGGSGHEPSHIGWVGNGMLDGAVCGQLFSSPSSGQIYETMKAISTGHRGILAIVTNHSGNRLNFGMACEKAKRELNHDVELVFVEDDCAIPRSRVGGGGRRGLAGTIFVHKVAGSAARQGNNLAEVCRRAKLVAKSIGTVGIALSSCSLPGQSLTFCIGEKEMEVGLGIHGEPGLERVPIKTSKETVKKCLDMILDLSEERTYFVTNPRRGDSVVLMINNLGGTSNFEMGIVMNDSVAALALRGFDVVRAYSGHFMTSLEMQGVSITLLRLPSGSDGDLILAALDEPVDCSAWRSSIPVPSRTSEIPYRRIEPETPKSPAMFKPLSNTALKLQKVLTGACKALLRNKENLNTLDKAEDGDYGDTIASGAKTLLDILGSDEEWQINLNIPSEMFGTISDLCEKHMGGSSGALYAIFFSAVSNNLRLINSIENLTAAQMSLAIEAGTRAIEKYGGAKLGDCTLIDALRPLTDAVAVAIDMECSTSIVLEQALLVSRMGAAATAEMKRTNIGRASYIDSQSLQGGVDPGAACVVIIVDAVASGFE